MATNFHSRPIMFLLLVIAFQLIEGKQSNDFRLTSSLCPTSTHAYRVVRTSYGLKCVVTKRLAEKLPSKSLSPELSPLESKLWELRGLKPIIPVRIIDHAINLVAPTVKTVAPARYKKVIIKNNRGPWKIDNQILVKSPKRKPPKLELKYAFFEEPPLENGLDSTTRPMITTTERPLGTPDGLLVNPEIVHESILRVPKLVVGSWMKMPQVLDENVFSSYGGFMRHESSTKIPSIVAATIERNSNNLLRRSWRDTSDDQTPDLMQDDSLINIKLKRNVLSAIRSGIGGNNNNNNKRRYLSNSGIQLKLDYPSVENTSSRNSTNDKQPTRITPIKIYVFLNRNQSAAEDYLKRVASGEFSPHTTSDMTSKYIANNEFVTSVSVSTTPPMSEEVMDFGRLSKLVRKQSKLPETLTKLKSSFDDVNKDEFKDVYADHLVNEGTERVEDYDELSYTETTSLAPLTRQWNFVCGDRKGFFADTENSCRAYYQCSVRGRQRFECPPNTRFNQHSLICDWSENVSCGEAVKENAMNAKVLVEHKQSSSSLPVTAMSATNARTTTTTTTSAPKMSTIASLESDEYYEDTEQDE